MNNSSRVTRIGGAAVLVAASTIVATLGTAAPAHAGGCTPVTNWCGGVTNGGSGTVPVTDNWTSSSATVLSPSANVAVSAYLGSGQRRGGNGSGTDVDGFLIPSGCGAYVSGFAGTSGYVQRSAGWYKISNNEQVTVSLYGSCGIA